VLTLDYNCNRLVVATRLKGWNFGAGWTMGAVHAVQGPGCMEQHRAAQGMLQLQNWRLNDQSSVRLKALANLYVVPELYPYRL
jgi:hypothetical protein